MRPNAADGVAWSVCHDRDLCKEQLNDCDAVWDADSMNCVLDGSRPHAEGQFGGKMAAHCKT